MIRLFQNLYTDKNPVRQKELDHCLNRNKNLFGLGLINSKIDRPTFSQLFDQINAIVTDEDVSIIANADIYFESFWDFALIQQTQAWCLSRWDYSKGSVTLFDRDDSQDVWAFRGKIKPVQNCDFGLGVPGCDNAISQRLHSAGYTVLNPSKSIKSIHLHNSNVRNYVSGKVKSIDKPYLLIKPHFYNESPSYRHL